MVWRTKHIVIGLLVKKNPYLVLTFAFLLLLFCYFIIIGPSNISTQVFWKPLLLLFPGTWPLRSGVSPWYVQYIREGGCTLLFFSSVLWFVPSRPTGPPGMAISQGQRISETDNWVSVLWLPPAAWFGQITSVGLIFHEVMITGFLL